MLKSGLKFLVLLIVALFIWWLWQAKSAALPQSKVMIGQQVFSVEIADNGLAMIKGLSGRSHLAKDHGMLFVYPSKAYVTFWMKDMNFPIDLLWIVDDKVVGLEENMSPEPGVIEEKLKRYNSPQAVDRVLEISAGSIEANNIKVGDFIKFSL